jgi:hypothetical protein
VRKDSSEVVELGLALLGIGTATGVLGILALSFIATTLMNLSIAWVFGALFIVVVAVPVIIKLAHA